MNTLKSKIIIVIIFLLMLIGIGLLTNALLSLNEKYNVQLYNVQELLEVQATYEAKNGKLVHQNNVLRLTNNELRNIIVPGLESELDNMRIKLKQVSQYSETGTNTNISVTVPLYDTLICYDTILIFDTIPKTPVKKFHYNDTYTDISGIILNDSVSLSYHSVDTLIQIIHKGKRKTWWKFWKKKPIVQAVTNKNPNSEINYSRILQIE